MQFPRRATKKDQAIVDIFIHTSLKFFMVSRLFYQHTASSGGANRYAQNPTSTSHLYRLANGSNTLLASLIFNAKYGDPPRSG